MGEIVTQNM